MVFLVVDENHLRPLEEEVPIRHLLHETHCDLAGKNAFAGRIPFAGVARFARDIEELRRIELRVRPLERRNDPQERRHSAAAARVVAQVGRRGSLRVRALIDVDNDEVSDTHCARVFEVAAMRLAKK
jgi:hypothetical protein